MTLDSSESHSIAEETGIVSKGQPETGRNAKSAPGDGDFTPGATTWSYISIHNMRVAGFEEQVKKDALFRCFVHKTWQKTISRGIPKKILKPTVSGLVFLQGDPQKLQRYLDENFSPFHLINDCSSHKPAVISDEQMQPFMIIASAHPERVRFLRKPFVKFAEDHTLLRVLSGPFKGQTGYIVRIDRDRQLVMDFGGIAVAFSGIRNEDVEPAEARQY